MLFLYLSALETEDERSKMAEIYETLHYTCLSVAMRITKNQAMAEDAVHNAFISLIKHKEKYLSLSRCKLRSQIVIIVKNKAIDLLRGEKNISEEPIDESDIISYEFDISEHIISKEAYKELVDCVSLLPEHYKVVFQLRYYHELSNKEIAEMLDEPQRHISVKIHRAKKELKKLLLKEGKQSG
ncbi:MAG: sigma-70 family RNA polymerase sigma factor [Oscillospiraceae bacterium]|nr:sigma-70 family RNA polymerase sigma factor [Oscillospiraceae bacterium]MCL2279504.1 sigma-70 family RNA polymerase sigma factor [Oscillospiraceae bacterium]